MSNARTAVQKDIAALRDASQSTTLIPVGGSGPDEEIARVLRNGLAVYALAALERFLRERVAELSIALTSHSHLKFGDLSEPLRTRIAVDSLEALSSELRRSLDPLSKVASIVAMGESLASLRSSQIKFSEFAFQWPGSNVRGEDLELSLRALGYKNPWGQLSEVVSRTKCGNGAPTIFRGLVDRRHSAAHDAGHTVSAIEVRSLHRDLLTLALCFDALFSDAVRCLVAGDLAATADTSRLVVTWVEKPQNAKKYRVKSALKRPRTFATFDDAVHFVVARDQKVGKGTLVVFQDSSGVIADWRLTVDT